jgi:hypothetical protein
MHLTSSWIVAVGGVFAATAAIATTATQVNVADPTVASRVSKVDVGDRLAVQEVPPASFYHSAHGGLGSGLGCVVVATPPSGKALIIRQVRVDAYSNSGGGTVYISVGTDCDSLVGDVTATTIGPSTTTFDPGLAIPHGSALSVSIAGAIDADVYVDGYRVDANVVPVVGGQTIEVSGKAPQR